MDRIVGTASATGALQSSKFCAVMGADTYLYDLLPCRWTNQEDA